MSWGGDIGMMSKTEDWSTPGPFRGNSRGLGKAAADMAKRFRMIRVPWRARLVGLGLAAGITLAAGGSAIADDQSSSANASVVDELLALVANPSAIAPSSIPKCSSPRSLTSPNPFRILDNQTYALCAVSSCTVFNGVAYCKCDVNTGDSISLTLSFDGENVCTVNEEGVQNGYMVSTYSFPESAAPGGDKAIYTCPSGSNGAYAQCDGGICFKSTQGKSSPFSTEQLTPDEIICSCPVTEQQVSYQISGPYPCDKKFFKNCSRAVDNNKTGSTIYVGSPTGTPRLITYLLYGTNLPAQSCH
jgi:hypothetical protein